MCVDKELVNLHFPPLAQHVLLAMSTYKYLPISTKQDEHLHDYFPSYKTNIQRRYCLHDHMEVIPLSTNDQHKMFPCALAPIATFTQDTLQVEMQIT